MTQPSKTRAPQRSGIREHSDVRIGRRAPEFSRIPLRGMLLLALALFVIGGQAKALAQAPAAADTADPLRVMTFNIRFNNASDGEDAWPKRKEKAASMIRLHGADLVGLQEALPEQIRDLRELMPKWKWAGLVTRERTGTTGEGVPIMYRADRLELLEDGRFWLSETPDEPGSKGWDAAIARLANWAKFRDRRSGKELLLLNTHFDHVGKVARQESAKMIVERAPKLAGDLPVIVVGDMNSVDSSPAYATFVEKPGAGGNGFQLVDALNHSQRPHHGPTSTFQGFKELPPNRRIDYIFVTPSIDVLQHAVLSDRWDDGRWPSDHLPVLAEVVID